MALRIDLLLFNIGLVRDICNIFISTNINIYNNCKINAKTGTTQQNTNDLDHITLPDLNIGNLMIVGAAIFWALDNNLGPIISHNIEVLIRVCYKK